MTTTASSIFARGVRRFLRAGFYALSALIWLVVAAAALEGFEQGRNYLEERRYKQYFDEQNQKVYRMVSREELLASQTQFSPTARENVFASAAPAPVVPTGEDVESARKAYAAQSEENLNVILTVQNDLLLEFDREANLISSHGEPLLESIVVPFARTKTPGYPFSKWPEALSAVKMVTAPLTMDCELQKSEMPCLNFFYRITVTPLAAPDGSIQRVQMLFHDVSPQMPPERLVGSVQPLGPDSPWAIPYYMYKKNWSRPNIFFSYNNFGFRDSDTVVPKPAGVIRIVCVGGSTTEEGNSNDTTYPHLLQTKLRAWLETDKVEVINCGIIGIRSAAERQRMPDFLALQPDLILYYNAINDICHRDFPIWLQNAGKLREILGKSKFVARHFNRWYLPSDDYIAEFLRATLLRNIKAMHYAAREKGIDMACCSFACPTVSQGDVRNRIFLDMNMRAVWGGQMLNFSTYREVMSLYNRLLKETCAEEGMYYVPVAENMHAGMDHFFDVCHVTPTGMELKTNIIGAYVKDYVQGRLSDAASPK
jgi:hypothetical protein